MANALGGNFYAMFPHNLLAGLFGAVFLFAILALGHGRDGDSGATSSARQRATDAPAARRGHATRCSPQAISTAAMATAATNEDDAFTLARRRFHHLTFYGFMLCFAATMRRDALSLRCSAFTRPTASSACPCCSARREASACSSGRQACLWLNLRRNPNHGDPTQRPMDRGFIALLLLTSATGLALLAWRDTAAMAWLLAAHLGVVMALFATLPYGKFAHGIYRVCGTAEIVDRKATSQQTAARL